jgi:hypothetical protein
MNHDHERVFIRKCFFLVITGFKESDFLNTNLSHLPNLQADEDEEDNETDGIVRF